MHYADAREIWRIESPAQCAARLRIEEPYATRTIDWLENRPPPAHGLVEPFAGPLTEEVHGDIGYIIRRAIWDTFGPQAALRFEDEMHDCWDADPSGVGLVRLLAAADALFEGRA